MNTFSEGDRVHIHGRSDYLGTVTADRDSMFPSMCGVRWADGEFAFVNPIKLAHVDPVAIPGMTEHERQALGTAYQRALDAVDPIGFVTSQNRTETGTDMVPDEDFTRDLATGIMNAYNVAWLDAKDSAWEAAAHYVIKRFRLDQ